MSHFITGEPRSDRFQLGGGSQLWRRLPEELFGSFGSRRQSLHEDPVGGELHLSLQHQNSALLALPREADRLVQVVALLI